VTPTWRPRRGHGEERIGGLGGAVFWATSDAPAVPDAGLPLRLKLAEHRLVHPGADEVVANLLHHVLDHLGGGGGALEAFVLSLPSGLATRILNNTGKQT